MIVPSTRPQLAWDLALAAVVGTLLVGEAIVETGGEVGAIACAAVMGLALIGRRTLPLASYVVSSLGLEGLVIWWYDAGLYPVANLIAIFSVGAYASRLRSVIGLVVGIAGVSAYWLIVPTVPMPALPAVVVGAWVVAWVAGQAEAARRQDAETLRTRLADADRRRAAELTSAMSEERNRIAREVHDIVGHALNVMVLHAGAGRRMLDRDRVAARDALDTVERVGREALGELNNVLGVLGSDPDRHPAPGLGDLDALAARFTGAGVPVDMLVNGAAPPLPKSVELAIYRVVQEALTNVAKHAGGRAATVQLDFRPDLIRLRITDDGPGGSADGGGRGLINIRERVAAAGGTTEAGPDPAGGWTVRCTIPVPA